MSSERTGNETAGSNGARPAEDEAAAARTPEEIEAQIEQQRQQPAGTIDALAGKLDVKGQAQAKVESAKAGTQARLADARHRVTTDSGGPRPEVLVFGATVVVVTVAIIWWRRR